MYHVFEGRGKAPKTKREKGKLPETKRKRENGNQQTLRSNSFREASRPRALTHARNETIARLSAPQPPIFEYHNVTFAAIRAICVGYHWRPQLPPKWSLVVSGWPQDASIV